MPQRQLANFIAALRGAGLRISPDEAVIAMEAAARVGYQPRSRFHDVLAISLVKQERDRLAFEETFARFFEGKSEGGQPPSAFPAAVLPAAESVRVALAELPPAQLQQQLAQAAAAMDFTRMQAITQQGLYSRRLLMQMGMGAVDDQIITLAAGNARQQAQAEQLRQWRSQVRAQAAALVRRQFLLHGAAHGRELREQALREVPFRQLGEFAEVKKLVWKMARRLASLHQRRLRKSRRGLLDARRTLVASVSHDGVPARLHWRRRPPHKSRVMVICDVSSSVRDAAAFLLQFLYAMNDVLPRVRSFAFAARFDEISEDFARYSPEVAVGRVLDRLSGSGTDYQAMLAGFWRDCERQLDRHTTVIILGDARNNYQPDGAELLAQIQRRVKQVWWLNPQRRNQWNSGDAVMDRYLPYCRLARPCGNLSELERVVDSLLAGLDR